jgi:DNA-binding XRE family transcriptional regulator
MIAKPQCIEVAGKRFVLIEEAEYRRLRDATGDESPLPELPKPDRNGNYPALEYARISVARDLITLRRRAGLSQQELADQAGVRQETVSRLESGKHTASVATIDKLWKVLNKPKSKSNTKRRATSSKSSR